jgi:hypothetical protein
MQVPVAGRNGSLPGRTGTGRAIVRRWRTDADRRASFLLQSGRIQPASTSIVRCAIQPLGRHRLPRVGRSARPIGTPSWPARREALTVTSGRYHDAGNRAQIRVWDSDVVGKTPQQIAADEHVARPMISRIIGRCLTHPVRLPLRSSRISRLMRQGEPGPCRGRERTGLVRRRERQRTSGTPPHGWRSGAPT